MSFKIIMWILSRFLFLFMILILFFDIIIFFHFSFTKMTSCNNNVDIAAGDEGSVGLTFYSDYNADKGSELNHVLLNYPSSLSASSASYLSKVKSIKITKALKNLNILLKSQKSFPASAVTIMVGTDITPENSVIIPNLYENRKIDDKVQVIVNDKDGVNEGLAEVEITTFPFLLTHPPPPGL